MKFSIIIITYNRKNELKKCLQSLYLSPCSHPFEVLVVYNGDSSYQYEMKKLFPNHSDYSIVKTTPADARNIATSKAIGEYFFFIDDDCELPIDYFSKIDFRLNWDVLGGPDQTPPSSSFLQKIIGHALSSPLCMGPTYKRHSLINIGKIDPLADEKSLILCNLWFKKSLFTSEDFFFEKTLFRNEENYLLKKLKRKQKKIYYDPRLFIYHSRKNNLRELAKSVVKSGESRAQNFFKLPDFGDLIYFSPLIFTFSFFALFFTALSSLIYVKLFFVIYTLAIFFYGSFKLGIHHFLFTFLHYFILFFYSMGLLRAFFKIGFSRFYKHS